MAEKSARNLAAEIQAKAEETRVVSQSNITYWKIFDGKIGEKEYPGFIPDRWSATCIPYGLWLRLQARHISQEQFNKQAKPKEIRIQNVDVKRHYDPDKWVIVASVGEARSKYGWAVPVPQTRRRYIGAVPKGGNPPTKGSGMSGLTERMERLRGNIGAIPDVNYSGENDTWYGNMLQTRESMAFHRESDAEPMLSLDPQSMQVNVGSTRTAHPPDQNIHGNLQENFLAQYIPSSAAIPVKNHIPYLGEIIAGVALLTAIMKAFAQAKEQGNSFIRGTYVVNPTEVIDYQTMSRTYHQDY